MKQLMIINAYCMSFHLRQFHNAKVGSDTVDPDIVIGTACDDKVAARTVTAADYASACGHPFVEFGRRVPETGKCMMGTS